MKEQMKRVQIFLNDLQMAELEKITKITRKAKSEVLRDCFTFYLDMQSQNDINSKLQNIENELKAFKEQSFKFSQKLEIEEKKNFKLLSFLFADLQGKEIAKDYINAVESHFRR